MARRARSWLVVMLLLALSQQLVPASTPGFDPMSTGVAARMRQTGATSVPTASPRWCLESGDASLQVLTLSVMSLLLPHSLLVAGDTVVIASQFTPAAVVAVEATTGIERWRVAVAEGRVFLAPASSGGAALFVASELGRVSAGAIDLASGERRWWTAFAGGVATPPAVGDDLLFIDASDGGLVALDVATGLIRWRVESDRRPGPLVATGTGLLVSGLSGGGAVGLDAETGATIWERAVDLGAAWAWTGAEGAGAVALTSWQGAPYLSGSTIVLLDAATGADRWRLRLSGLVATGPTLAAGTLFFATSDGATFALDVATGAERWRWSAADLGHRVTFRGSAPVVADDLVLVAGAGWRDETLYGVVFALDGATGRLRWLAEARNIIDTPPLLTDRVLVAGDLGEGSIAFTCAYDLPDAPPQTVAP